MSAVEIALGLNMIYKIVEMLQDQGIILDSQQIAGYIDERRQKRDQLNKQMGIDNG